MAADSDIFAKFLENTRQFRNVIPMNTTGVNAAGRVGSVDMVFIDANHSYQSVKADILAWKDKAIRMVCGHDYDTNAWPGVVRAVDEIFGDKAKTFESIWYVEKEDSA
jgi:hypothetical protein